MTDKHIRGGQGRTSSDLQNDGIAMICISLAFILLFAALAVKEVLQ